MFVPVHTATDKTTLTLSLSSHSMLSFKLYVNEQWLKIGNTFQWEWRLLTDTVSSFTVELHCELYSFHEEAVLLATHWLSISAWKPIQLQMFYMAFSRCVLSLLNQTHSLLSHNFPVKRKCLDGLDVPRCELDTQLTSDNRNAFLIENSINLCLNVADQSN